jgi:adenine deaminase
VAVPPSMNLDPRNLDFSIPAKGRRMRVIRAIADQVVTRCEVMDVTEKDGLAVADVARDVSRCAVVDRYTGKARTGKGFVTGLGLKRGAIASSVAHDSHNIIVAGAADGTCARRWRPWWKWAAAWRPSMTARCWPACPCPWPGSCPTSRWRPSGSRWTE